MGKNEGPENSETALDGPTATGFPTVKTSSGAAPQRHEIHESDSTRQANVDDQPGGTDQLCQDGDDTQGGRSDPTLNACGQCPPDGTPAQGTENTQIHTEDGAPDNIPKFADYRAQQWDNRVADTKVDPAQEGSHQQEPFLTHPVEDESESYDPPQPRFPPHRQFPPQSSTVPEPQHYAGQIASLQQQMATLNQSAAYDRQILARKLQQAELRNQKLNQIIAKQSRQFNEPSDEEIIMESGEIRRLTLNVIRDNYVVGSKRLTKDVHRFWPPELRNTYDNCSAYRRLDLCKAHLFKIINQMIFKGHIFGLGSEMDDQLARFERQVTTSGKTDSVEAAEWRARTVMCALRLVTNDIRAANYICDKAREVSDELYCFLRALEMKQSTLARKSQSARQPTEQDLKQSVDRLYGSLCHLCERAIKLALRLRASTTHYAFEAYPDHTIVAVCDPKTYEVMGEESHDSDTGDARQQRILGTLFGALVKTRNPGSEIQERVVLQKSEIIVYETLQKRVDAQTQERAPRNPPH